VIPVEARAGSVEIGDPEVAERLPLLDAELRDQRNACAVKIARGKVCDMKRG